MVQFRFLLEPPDDFRFFNRPDRPVAFGAPCKWTGCPGKREPHRHLAHLFAHLIRSYAIAVCHFAAFEKAPVPRQDDSSLPAGDGRNLAVGIIVAVEGIESEEAQKPAQPPQVYVADEKGGAAGDEAAGAIAERESLRPGKPSPRHCFSTGKKTRPPRRSRPSRRPRCAGRRGTRSHP